jgi:hypothetical protein
VIIAISAQHVSAGWTTGEEGGDTGNLGRRGIVSAVHLAVTARSLLQKTDALSADDGRGGKHIASLS